MRFPHRIAAAVLCLVAGPVAVGSVHAAQVGAVEVVGLDEVMTDNVTANLSLVEAPAVSAGPRRRRWAPADPHHVGHRCR